MTKGTEQSHTHRILTVAETVANRGPIVLNDLVHLLPFSRGAIWRCLDTLRAKGWVRMRNGDGAYELNFEVYKTFANAHVAPAHILEVAQLVSALKQFGPFHVDYGEFIDEGFFSIRETTRRDGYNREHLSLTDEDISIAAQLALSKTELIIHLRVFMETASNDERLHIQSGRHNADLLRHKSRGIVWGPDKASCSIPLSSPNLPRAAFRLEITKHTEKARDALHSTVLEIQSRGLINLLESVMVPDTRPVTGPI